MTKREKCDRITYIILAVIVGLNVIAQLWHLADYHHQTAQAVPVTEYTSRRLSVVYEPNRAIRTLTMEATAYCEVGTTRSGTQAGPNTAAVDPKVIPLGTQLYVEGYGPAVAADTGRLIKGNRIDLWMEDYDTCISFGRRQVEVTVIGEE